MIDININTSLCLNQKDVLFLYSIKNLYYWQKKIPKKHIKNRVNKWVIYHIRTSRGTKSGYIFITRDKK